MEDEQVEGCGGPLSSYYLIRLCGACAGESEPAEESECCRYNSVIRTL